VRFEDRPPAAGEQFYTPCDRFNSDRQTGRSTVLKIWEVFKKIRLSPFDEFLLQDYIFPHRWSKCLQSRSPYFVLEIGRAEFWQRAGGNEPNLVICLPSIRGARGVLNAFTWVILGVAWPYSRVCLCPTVITGTSLIGKLRVHAGRVSHCQDAIPKGVL
ncbi:hypothetical protein T08_4463, partial [Trichinella sp. T8]